jgi:hypothetical protein
MKIQNNGETATSEHARHNLWQRLSPFLDVIGAALIFGSWIFSHTLSQRAQDRANTHQSIITRVRQFRLYDDFAQRISNIQSDLVRTRNLVEYANQRGNSLDATAASPSETLTWTGMTATQIREMADFVQALEGQAGQLSASETITQSIEKAKSGVNQLSKAFEAARVEFDRLVEQRNMSGSAADNDQVTVEQEQRLRKHVDRLWQDYDAAKQNMLHVGDDLLRSAAAESGSASQLAKKCERLSWALYIVGTLIVLYGRAKSVLSARKSSGD